MEINDVLLEKLGWPGTMLSGSKSLYRERNPNNIVIFNSNIAIPSKGKVWYGDIDITKSLTTLKEISILLNEPIYIFYEMAYRFENEFLSLNEVIEKTPKYYIIDSGGLQEITK